MNKKQKIELMVQEIRKRGGLGRLSDNLNDEQWKVFLQEILSCPDCLERRSSPAVSRGGKKNTEAHLKDTDPMRTTLNLDDALLEKARSLSGIQGKTALVHAGLQALIAHESARRLSALGGTNRDLRSIPRRRRARLR
jgi:Arc/MetJ family transcription regulator